MERMNKNRKNGVVYRNDAEGNNNSKYIDLLDEDKAISGQKFACISFISPEKVLKEKNIFYFDKFLNQFDFKKSLDKFNHFVYFLSYKYNLSHDDLKKDLDEFCIEEKNNLFLTTLEDDYKSYIELNSEKLDEEFNEKHSFQTSVRGIKIRGCFPNQTEAELRCKMLREIDPNHDVYVGPVGIWMPFHPEAYKTGRVEYLEDELNQIMSEKHKNEKEAKINFEKRVKESKEKAIDDNMKKALESGNVLTQTLDKDSNLISVKNMNTSELNMLNNDISEVRKELFEGDNIVTDIKNSDHGLSQLKCLNEETTEKESDE